MTSPATYGSARIPAKKAVAMLTEFDFRVRELDLRKNKAKIMSEEGCRIDNA